MFEFKVSGCWREGPQHVPLGIASMLHIRKPPAGPDHVEPIAVLQFLPTGRLSMITSAATAAGHILLLHDPADVPDLVVGQLLQIHIHVENMNMECH